MQREKRTSAIVAEQISEDNYRYVLIKYNGFLNNPGVGNRLLRHYTMESFLKDNGEQLEINEPILFSDLLDLANDEKIKEEFNIKHIYINKLVDLEEEGSQYKWSHAEFDENSVLSEFGLLSDKADYGISFPIANPDEEDFETFCSYYTAANWLGKYILFNKAPELDEWLLSEIIANDEDEEIEIFQFYMTDLIDSDVEWMNSAFPELLYAWSEVLEKWILCVDHYGTSWDYVPTRYVGDLRIPDTDKMKSNNKE